MPLDAAHFEESHPVTAVDLAWLSVERPSGDRRITFFGPKIPSTLGDFFGCSNLETYPYDSLWFLNEPQRQHYGPLIYLVTVVSSSLWESCQIKETKCLILLRLPFWCFNFLIIFRHSDQSVATLWEQKLRCCHAVARPVGFGGGAPKPRSQRRFKVDSKVLDTNIEVLSFYKDLTQKNSWIQTHLNVITLNINVLKSKRSSSLCATQRWSTVLEKDPGPSDRQFYSPTHGPISLQGTWQLISIAGCGWVFWWPAILQSQVVLVSMDCSMFSSDIRFLSQLRPDDCLKIGTKLTKVLCTSGRTILLTISSQQIE